MSALEDRVARVYLEQFPYWEDSPTYLADLQASAQSLATALGGDLSEPENDDNYYRIQIPVTPGVRGSRFELDVDVVARLGQVVYLEVLVAVIAPVAEASWAVYTVTDDVRDRQTYELLDPVFLQKHPDQEARAEAVLEAVDNCGLELLDWDVTRAPADPRLPADDWMGGTPQLRHFLLPGYWE